MSIRSISVFISAWILSLSGCCGRQSSESGAVAATSQPVPAAWYEQEIQAFETADRASPPLTGQALFIGSSSIRLWTSLVEDMSPVPVLNRGFGGSKTGEVLAVFDRIVLPYEPSIIVYYCGDNDLGLDKTDSEATANGFIAFERRARNLWPDIQVFYIPIKPSVQRWSNWAAMARTNTIVREYCKRTPGATYLDTVSPTLTSDGMPDSSMFREDGLHMNAKGYSIWTRVIRQPVLDAWKSTRK